ncbi:phage tail tape measure protein [Paenibacillus pedocola]|uniref:phage tail tape measure protein n=1 Tax=Paenibacillus pedocola TaxID=3242193 RepID=UPI002877DC5C|nr:phage tail tape measure protein [Paenibacillus typhae]
MAGSISTRNSYDIVFQLNAIVTPAFRRSVGQAEDSVEEIARIIRDLSRLPGFESLRRDAEAADDTVDDLSKSTSGLEGLLGNIKEKTELFSGIKEGIEPLTKIMNAMNESADAMAQLQASTGMTTDQMKNMEEISNNLYRQNYGKGFEDLGDSLALVKQILQQSGDELEKTTQNAITYRDVFKGGLPDSLKAVNAMMQQFGITSEQSYNLMAQGAQKGLNSSGQLLDTASEYSVYFDKMGYSANEMFGVFSAGIEHGAASLSGVADAVKEFSTAVTGDSDSAKEAIYKLFAPEQLEKFSAALVKSGTKSAEYATLLKAAGKKVADTLTKDLTAGGDSAEQAMKELQKTLGSGKAIFKGLADGSLTGKQAMEQVIQKLKEIKDPVEQAQIASELFGSQFADIGSEAILALGSTRSQFDMTRQTMEEVAAVKYSTLTQQFQAVGREMMTGLIVPLGENLMPLLQGLVHWMSSNKELMMVLSLAAPAAALTTNTLKIVQGFKKIGGAAGGASGAAGGFAGALGLLTNPVGIAVGALGLITAGVITYKKHQEEARLDLLNMGDALGAAYNNYEEIDQASKRNQDLITEYDRLTKKINDAKTPADELTEARRKLQLVEQELIDMNPDILSAEGSKNSKFREQLDLVEDIYASRKDMSKREIEHDALAAQGKMPQLEEQYSELTENLSKQNAAYEKAKVSYRDYWDYMNQLDKINSSDASEEEKGQQRNALAAEIEKSTGKNYSANWASFQFDYADISESFDKYNAKIEKTQSEMNEAQQSFASYYDLQKRLVEIDLGGSLEEKAKKYNELSSAEKEQFNQAMSNMAILNQEVDMLPDAKKINLQLIWEQTGQVPDFSLTDEDWKVLHKTMKEDGSPDLKTAAGQKLNRLAQHDPGFEGYADGGIATRPSIFGEAGPEIAIPLNTKPRSRSLLEKANDLMGYSSSNNVNEGNIQVTWAPQVTIQGGTPSIAAEVAKAMQDQQPAFEQRFQRMIQQQRRVSFQ